MGRTAQEILEDARNRFNTTSGLRCPSACGRNIGHKFSGTSDPTCGHHNCPTNYDIYYVTDSISTENAMYCAEFDSQQHYSSTTKYNCPGHRNSNEESNRYPNPTSLNNGRIIYASQLNQLYKNIKQEITTRLNHIFYSYLTYT